jgi:hypothetical protein
MQIVLPQPVSAVPVPAERTPVIVVLHAATANAPQNGAKESAPQPDERFFLIARTAPPAAGPNFEQQLPALRENPGRPLDPGQWMNLVAGRSAGLATVQEFPPESMSSINPTCRRVGVK